MRMARRIPITTSAVLGILLALAVGAAGAAGAAGENSPAAWRTPAEIAEYEATPSLADTLAFLERIAERLPEMRLLRYGTSAAGRPLTVAVVSKDRAFGPAAARATGKPVVLIVNGIHAGEIDGKDACLELLRDLALGRRRELLDAGTLLVLPVYNVDGHERVSPYHRPNQDGPVRGMGFRTTVDGHDLNRDWLKVETPEARALVALVRDWDPHLVIDDHVTNGSDHDWTVTWSYPEAPQSTPVLAAWTKRAIDAGATSAASAGYRSGPYVDLLDRGDPARGFETATYPPRFSTGYFALRNRATILVETHSHKPYRDRVPGNREFLAGVLAELARSGEELVAATAAADRAAAVDRAPLVVEWETPAGEDRIRFPVYDGYREPSVVSGGELLRYRRGRVREVEVPWRHGARAARTVPRPAGYWVPAGWSAIEERLAVHGVRVERTRAPVDIDVETIRVRDAEPADGIYQGRVAISGTFDTAREVRRLPAGSLWIPGDQPLFALAANLLEPSGPDSLFAWGFLAGVVEMKEYIGSPALEDEARRLLEDPGVRAEWEAALADEAFAGDRMARYLWWYRRTPYWDDEVGLLPVYRAPAGVSAGM
jgi:hypothetical protein